MLAQLSMSACIMLLIAHLVTQQEVQPWTMMPILKFHLT